jgi:hypothetical protein
VLGEQGADGRSGGLAVVLRRLAVDPPFAAAVDRDPADALAAYRLSGEDLAALSLWLEAGRRTGDGIGSLFEERP